jgi:hypothetical protein
VKIRTVSRRVRHVRQLTVPVVLGFHQRPSVQFAGFQFNLIRRRRRRRRRRKVVSVQFYAGRSPSNTLSEEEETEENSIPNIKETVSFSAFALPLFPSHLFSREQAQEEEEEEEEESDNERKFRRSLSFRERKRTERFHTNSSYRDHVPFALVHQLHRNPDAFA